MRVMALAMPAVLLNASPKQIFTTSVHERKDNRMNRFDNLNLGFLAEDEDTVGGLVGLAIKEGKVRTGYSGNSYINYEPGDAQFVVRVIHDKNTGTNEAVGLDVHAAGCGIWEVVVSGVAMDYTEKDALQKRLVVNKPDGSGMAVVDLLNADVLPSVLPGERIKIQVAAFPLELDYFKDEEEYDGSLQKDIFGRSVGIENGSVFPVGLLHNGTPELEERPDQDDESWGYTMVRGIVKRLFQGKLSLYGEELNPFIRCLIETQFGDLEIVHAFDQIKKEQLENVKEGAIVSCLCSLSADAGIFQYDKGAVYDEKNDLILFKDAMIRQTTDRLSDSLTEDVICISSNGQKRTGKEDVLGFLEAIGSERTKQGLHTKCWDAIAEEQEGKADKPEDVKGRSCLVIGYEENDYQYESTVDLDVNEDGRISRITFRNGTIPTVRIDEYNSMDKSDDEEFTPVTDPLLAMATRAKFIGFLEYDEDEEIEEMVSSALNDEDVRGRAQEATALMGFPSWKMEHLYKLSEILFLKAFEMQYAWKKLAPYEYRSVEDIYKSTDCDCKIKEAEELFEEIQKTSKHFQHDIEKLESLRESENFKEIALKVFVFIQLLGKRCADKVLEGKEEARAKTYASMRDGELFHEYGKEEFGITEKEFEYLDSWGYKQYYDHIAWSAEEKAHMDKVFLCVVKYRDVTSEDLENGREGMICPWESPWQKKFYKTEAPTVSDSRPQGLGYISKCFYKGKNYYYGINKREEPVTRDMVQNGEWYTYTWAD